MVTIEMIILMIFAIMGGMILFLQLAFVSFVLSAAHWELE